MTVAVSNRSRHAWAHGQCRLELLAGASRSMQAIRPDHMPVHHDIRRQLRWCRSGDNKACSQLNLDSHEVTIVSDWPRRFPLESAADRG